MKTLGFLKGGFWDLGAPRGVLGALWALLGASGDLWGRPWGLSGPPWRLLGGVCVWKNTKKSHVAQKEHQGPLEGPWSTFWATWPKGEKIERVAFEFWCSVAVFLFFLIFFIICCLFFRGPLGPPRRSLKAPWGPLGPHEGP